MTAVGKGGITRVMGDKRMLRGYKDIAEALKSILGFTPGPSTMFRWSKQPADPLPVRRFRAGDGGRPILIAQTEDVERWARKRLNAENKAA